VPTILIEFEPKEASPLEIINTLNKILEQNLTEGKITDYAICLPTDEDLDLDVIDLVSLVVKTPQAKTPPKEE
jgi:hypothetical protein